MQAQRGSKGITLLFKLSTSQGYVVNSMPHSLYPVPTV